MTNGSRADLGRLAPPPEVHRLARILSTIAHGLSSAEEPRARLERALDLLALLVPYDRSALHYREYNGEERLITAPRDIEKRILERVRSIHARLADDEDPVSTHDPRGGSHLAIPLAGIDRIEGVLYVESDRPAAYDTASLSHLTVVGAHLATYLANLRMRAHEASMSSDLAQAAEFQKLMMAVVGHDLRNPLSTILHAAELMRTQNRDEKSARLTRLVARSAERASRIIADLLDVTRARTGSGMPVAPRRMLLSTLVTEAVEEARARNPEREIELETSGTDPVAGDWDPDRIAQAIGNLLTNALDYGAAGTKVLVRLRAGESVATVDVNNHGAVIPPEIAATLFDPFKRGRTSKASKGLGLGLYIVREIATAHRGAVVLHSSETEGTTFTLTLPR